MISLSDREAALLERLKTGPATTDDLHVAVARIAPTPRKSIPQMIKYIGAKIGADGMFIVRTSPVGRGHIGRYELRNVEGGHD